MKRPIMKKRGIEMPRDYVRDFEKIENKYQERFITHLEVFVLPIVREFYANAKEKDDDYVLM